MIVSRQRPARRPGTSMVEFVLVATVFLLFLLGVLEYARLMFTMQLMNNAAREGARYAVVNAGTATTANVQAYVNNFMAGQGTKQLTGYTTGTNISVYMADPTTATNTGLSWQNAGWGDAIGVTVSGTYKPIIPGFIYLAGNLSLTGSCVMTTEAN
ncbi:MAG: TadE/TadG family type IV pilus assembly protein [Gemmataceae bacterium]